MTRLLATAFVMCCALSAKAFARPKVALGPIDDDEVQDAVTDALDTDELTLVASEQVTHAVDKLGLDTSDMSEHDVKKLERELDVDAVVLASLSEKDGYQVLHFRLYIHGKKQRGFKIQFGSAKSPKFKHALHDKLIEKLAELTAKKDDDSGGGDGGDDDHARHAKHDDDGGGDAADAGSGDHADHADHTDHADQGDADAGGDHRAHKDDDGATSDDDHGRKAHKRTASDDDDSDGGDLHGHSDDTTTQPAGRTANRAAIRIEVGPSITARQLTFNSNLTPDHRPAGYHNSPVPGARVDGAIYPFALGNPDGALAGLGLAGSYDKTILLSLRNSVQPDTKFPANEQHWALGPRFRILFGHAATSPSLTLGVDYGHRTFTIDRHALMPGNVIDVPDVDYRGFTPNLELRVPFAPAVALVVGGGSLLATGAGSIQSASQYGRAKVTEAEGHAGIDIVIGRRFAITLVGEYAQIGFQFDGTGMLANDRDMNPATKDVGGAADRYYGGAATFAVLY